MLKWQLPHFSVDVIFPNDIAVGQKDLKDRKNNGDKEKEDRINGMIGGGMLVWFFVCAVQKYDVFVRWID